MSEPKERVVLHFVSTNDNFRLVDSEMSPQLEEIHVGYSWCSTVSEKVSQARG
jgi:hypothetical protein